MGKYAKIHGNQLPPTRHPNDFPEMASKTIKLMEVYSWLYRTHSDESGDAQVMDDIPPL